MSKQLNFASKVIHAGQENEAATGAVIPPIFATSTFAQKAPGSNSGYEYSRSKNPTREALERMMAELELGVGALAFASGMAAITSVLELLQPHDHVIVNEDIYGGTWRLFEKLKRYSSGLEFTYVDMGNPDAVISAIKPNTKMFWLETPSNPMMRVTDIKAITSIAKDHNILSVVDNTFATPYIQKPLLCGADIVVHSVTKYLNGHSDVLGGVVVAANESLHEKLAFIQKCTGAVLSPFDSFLVLRGIKTLAVRMEKHCSNAEYIAGFLQKHPKVKQVFYPGLTSHPQHAVAKSQMLAGFGGVVSFAMHGEQEDIVKFMQNCRLFTLAESLGGVESLIEQPLTMTHASLDSSHKEKLGIDHSIVRLSIGIEDPQDLEADLIAAFK